MPTYFAGSAGGRMLLLHLVYRHIYILQKESAESSLEKTEEEERNVKGETNFLLWMRQYILLLLKFKKTNPYLVLQSPASSPVQ